MLARLTVVTIAQYIQIANWHVVYPKLVSWYMLIIPAFKIFLNKKKRIMITKRKKGGGCEWEEITGRRTPCSEGRVNSNLNRARVGVL